MKSLVLILLAVLISVGTQAADTNGKYFIVGTGSRACQEYTAATDQQKVYADTWIAGYISAINRTTPDTWHVAGETSVEKFNAMIAQHCAGNPEVAIGVAVHRVLERLYPDRTRLSPNK